MNLELGFSLFFSLHYSNTLIAWHNVVESQIQNFFNFKKKHTWHQLKIENIGEE